MSTNTSARTEYTALVAKVALLPDIGVDPDLLEAIMIKESAGRADAFRFEPAFYDRYLKDKPEWRDQIPRRIASSYGLCQVMFTTARQLGFKGEPELLFIPENSLYWGGRYLKHLLQWSGFNEHKACAAYNGGQGNWRGDGPQSYADDVLAIAAGFRS